MQETALTPIETADESDEKISQTALNAPGEQPNASDVFDDASEQSIPTPLSVAAKYQFIKKIGQGSQAKVFLARRRYDNQMVAVKQLDIESVSSWKEYDLFRREAAVLSTLNVDGVAHFYEAIECIDDIPPCSYLVQEYIEGQSIGDMIRAGHRFTTDEVYDIIIQVLTILYQLHSRPDPVIHRDIKPSNIMLTPIIGGYDVTIIDFGAVANPQVQSGGSTVAGTYGYMPPEQLMGRPQPASDIYSLAAVAVELFTGKSPATMPTKDFRLIFEPEMQAYPHALVATLRKMLDPDASSRSSDSLQLIQTFKQFRKGDFKQHTSLKKTDYKYETKYEKRLSEVKDFAAPGNIALWQTLSDETPRSIPNVYKFANWNSGTQGAMSVKDDILVGRLNRLSDIVKTCLFVFFFVICAIFAFVPAVEAVIALLSVFVVVVIPLAIASVVLHLRRKKLGDRRPHGMSYHVSELLKNGHKTIATIVDVEYLPVRDALQMGELVVADARPRFRIKYKFNPPDDFRDEELIHECIVCNEPENTYRAGDPFPILYNIEGQNFDEVVRSMPFPYPLYCISERDVVGSSTAGGEFWKYANRLIYANRLKKKGNFRFIEYRNDLDVLGPAIARIADYKGLSQSDIQSSILPLLNCYLKSDRYIAVHHYVIRYMIGCIRQLPASHLQINEYFQNYLSTMCAGGNIQSPNACELLVSEIDHPGILTGKVIDMLLDLYLGDSGVDSVPENISPDSEKLSEFKRKLLEKRKERASASFEVCL